MMGPDVMIFALGHETARTDIPMIDQGFIAPKPVAIHDDVWIGARVIILPGVTIGRGSVLGAGAVITREVPEYCIVAGNPAKIVGRRNGQNQSSQRSETR